MKPNLNRHPLALGIHGVVLAARVAPQLLASTPSIDAVLETHQVCGGCQLVVERTGKACHNCGAQTMKPKRIRSRHKPLTAYDVVEGGVYVPKRGNDKSPNLTVVDLDRIESERYGVLVTYLRAGDEDTESCNLADFLALVSRRVEA